MIDEPERQNPILGAASLAVRNKPVAQLDSGELNKLLSDAEESARVSTPDAVKRKWIDVLISSRVASIEGLQAVSDAIVATPYKDLRGGIGFAIFLNAAEQFWSLHEDYIRLSTKARTEPSEAASIEQELSQKLRLVTEQKNRADAALGRKDVIEFIYREYSLPEFARHAKLKLFHVGTTSLILELVQAGTSSILKIIKPQFFANTQITQTTVGYERYLESLRTAAFTHYPDVYYAGPRWINMEKVRGETLKEHIDGLAQRGEQEGRERAIGRLLLLARSLKLLRGAHGDLSPSNIILYEGRPWLIDFGYNFSLTESIGVSRMADASRRYVAPEGDMDPANIGVKRDLYSLGVIVLDLLYPALRHEDPAFQLERVWSDFPEIADVVDSLLEPNPRYRLPEAVGDPVAMYDVLEQRLRAELRRSKLTRRGVVLSGLIKILKTAEESLQWLFKVAQHTGKKRLTLGSIERASLREVIYLFKWRTAVDVCLTACIWFIGKGLIERVGKPLQVADWRLGAVTMLPEWQQLCASLLVALAVALAIWQDDGTVFSSIAIRSWPGDSYDECRKATMTELTMRLTPFGIACCLLWALLRPKAWPWASVVGPLLIAYHNWVIYRFARHVVSSCEGQIRSVDSPLVKAFVDEFKTWPLHITFLAAGIALFGVLLRLGLAKDEWLYGTLLAVVVFLRLHLSAAIQDGPTVSRGLRRLVGIQARLSIGRSGATVSTR